MPQQGEILPEVYIDTCNNHVWGSSHVDQNNSMFPEPHFMFVVVSEHFEKKDVKVHDTAGDRDATVATLVAYTAASDSPDKRSKTVHLVTWKQSVADLFQVG